jgi:hypothetical protein
LAPVRVAALRNDEGGELSFDTFKNLTVGEQLIYLRGQVEEGCGLAGPDKGAKAAYLRSLRDGMKVEGLFSHSALSRKFMNETLRDFLNISENGAEDYTWRNIRKDTNWSEMVSIGAQKHQTTAPNSRAYVTMVVTAYNRLNAKFTHRDGREAVFRYRRVDDGLLITDYPDKGTYNYFPGEGTASILSLLVESRREDGKHYRWDMEPFDRLIAEKKRTDRGFRRLCEDLARENGGDKYNDIGLNSSYWKYD